MTDTCPECREPITPDYVDIGVGNLRAPDRCLACGWVEPREYGIIEDDDPFGPPEAAADNAYVVARGLKRRRG